VEVMVEVAIGEGCGDAGGLPQPDHGGAITLPTMDLDTGGMVTTGLGGGGMHRIGAGTIRSGVRTDPTPVGLTLATARCS